jgi:lipopolysaccharide biosynthesis glycosyltransferase
MTRASGPVSITPISLTTLKDIYTRERSPGQSTDFTFARFLTPYLAGAGTSVFLDSDMLCLCDIYELVNLARQNIYADVLVVKHDYEPKKENKFLNQKQTSYPCKNWSSVMVFNGHRMGCRKLTPEYVNQASPMDLHQFRWAVDVGELPPEYNHLVGEYKPNPGAKIVHYTLGAPCFRSYQQCEFAEEWFNELGEVTHCDDPILELRDAHLSRLRKPHSG